MRLKIQVAMLCAVLFTTGCYLPIKGRVVDAETQQPIEGAIVLVEWTKKHGFGDAWTESYKVVETVSDKEGNVKISGCYSPFVEQPDVTVYKKGYVAWSSRWIFPGSKNRTDFTWGDKIFRLEQFKEGYSYVAHVFFISLSINESINSKSKRSIQEAFDWESKMANMEREKKGR